MAKVATQKKAAKPTRKSETAELPDLKTDSATWKRFEELLKSAAKMGHKPHQPPKRAASSK